MLNASGQLYNDLQWRSSQKQRVKMQYQVEGRVFGTDSFEPNPFPLQGAAVKVMCVADTTEMDGGSAGHDGRFWTWLSVNQRLKDPSVRVVITYIGMETLDSIFMPEHKKVDGIDTYTLYLDSLVLHSDPITTEEVEIIAELQKMYQRGDTVIFNADAFEMPTGSVLLDLVRRLPGLKMENGKMTYLGQDINEIRLNGDSFFQHDMSIALNNMPTDKLKSLKVYEVPIDTLDVMSKNHLIMDMETKEPIAKTVFGQLALSTTEKFNHYGYEGYADTWAKKGPSFDFNARHDDLPSNYSMKRNSTSLNGGLSNNGSRAVYVNLRGNYDKNYNESKSKELSRDFLPDYTQKSVGEHTSSNGDRSYGSSLNLSTNLEHGHISVTTQYNGSQSTDSSQSTDTIFIEGTGPQTANRNRNSSDRHSNNFSISSGYSRSIYRENANGEKDYKGNLSTSLNLTKANSENISDEEQTNRFFMLGDSVRNIHRRINSGNDRNSLGFNLSYSWNLKSDQSSYGYLSISSNTNFSQASNSKIYNNLDADGNLTGRVDSLDTSSGDNNISDRISLNYSCSDSISEGYFTLSATPRWQSVDNTRGSRSEHLTQGGVQYNFSGSYRLRVFKKDRIGFSLDGSNSLPSINDKSSLTDYSNHMYIREGNDDLKNPFSINAGMDYQYHSWMRVSVNYTTTINSIANLTRIDQTTGAQRSKPINVNGNWNIRESLFMTHDINDVVFNWNTEHSYRRGVSFIQNMQVVEPQKSYSDYHSVSTTLDMAYGDKYWMINAATGYSYDYNKSEYLTKATIGQNIRANARIEYTADFGLGVRTSVNYRKPFGYEMESANRSELIWNMDIHYRFLKGRKAEFSVSWNDILNDHNNFNANMSGTSWHESQTFNERSMIVFRLSYRPNYFD